MATQQPDQTVITITLPEDGDLPRTGTIVTQHKDLATVCQFQYSDLDGIIAAMVSSAEALSDVERNPPPMEIKGATSAEVMKKSKAKDKPAEQPAATDTPEGEAAPEQDADVEPAAIQESFIADDDTETAE